MKFERVAVQGHVDRFSKAIRRNIGIGIEDITVRKNNFNFETIMRTSWGEILIGPSRNYDINACSFERLILHELGHRAQEALNPRMDCFVMRGLVGYDLYAADTSKQLYGIMKLLLSGNKSVPYSLAEGIAEYFALDVFSEVCSVSNDGKAFIDRLRKIRQRPYDPRTLLGCPKTSRGYRFFHELHSSAGAGEVIRYVKYFSSKNVPSRLDLSRPKRYWQGRMHIKR